MANKEYKFYFDMDNTLVNFNAHLPKYAIGTNRPSEKLDGDARSAKIRMWREIENTPNFWRDLPMTDGISSVLNAAQNIGELFVLSKTPRAKNFIGGEKYVNFVASEKRDWILRNLGDYFVAQNIIICTGPKGELVSPTTTDILVDDRIDNIEEWRNMGGRGIHFLSVQSALYSILHTRFI
jgi:5'(3')-deoxyribonucleotidase